MRASESELSYPAYRWTAAIKCACPPCTNTVPVKGEFCRPCREEIADARTNFRRVFRQQRMQEAR